MAQHTDSVRNYRIQREVGNVVGCEGDADRRDKDNKAAGGRFRKVRSECEVYGKGDGYGTEIPVVLQKIRSKGVVAVERSHSIVTHRNVKQQLERHGCILQNYGRKRQIAEVVGGKSEAAVGVAWLNI